MSTLMREFGEDYKHFLSPTTFTWMSKLGSSTKRRLWSQNTRNNMQVSIWKFTFGLGKSSNDSGVGVSLDFYKSPYWEVELSAQALLPWELSFRIAQRIS